MNLQTPNFIDIHQDIAQMPQDNISINLLRPYNVTSQDNSYALTAVCNLTGYLMTTPIKDIKTTSVANHLFLDRMLYLVFVEYYTLTMALNLNLNLWKTFPSNLA